MAPASSAQWHPGMDLPPAEDPCKNRAETYELELAMEDEARNFGIATVDDPMIIWLHNLPLDDMREDMVSCTNDIATLVAQAAGLPYVWVIREPHNLEYLRDENGGKIFDPENPNKQLLAHTDYHVTLRLGTGLFDCVVTAHAWVVMNDRGLPQRLIKKEDRTPAYIRYGHGEEITFWPWTGGVVSKYWRNDIGEKVARIFPPTTPEDVCDVYIGGPVPPRNRVPNPPCGGHDNPCQRCRGRLEREEAYGEYVQDAEDSLRHSRSRDVNTEYRDMQVTHHLTSTVLPPKPKHWGNPNMVPIAVCRS